MQSSQGQAENDSRTPERMNHSSVQVYRIYNYYRFILISVLLISFTSGISKDVLGSLDKELFFNVAVGYFLYSIINLCYTWISNGIPTAEQVFSIIVIDLFFITTLMFYSGGNSSGLGYLTFFCVITASLFIQGKVHYALTAIASVLLISCELIGNITSPRALFSAGSMGVMLFVTSWIFQSISKRLKQSEDETLAQSEHSAYLEHLTHRIVARLYTGVIVVNENDEVEIINNSAQLLLNIDSECPKPPFKLESLAEIHLPYSNWKEKPHSKATILRLKKSPQELRVGFVQQAHDTLIFIDDNQQVYTQAQQLKLASLGRLTASIAHEIRNPLGALSHANQLLQESPHIHPDDSRLVEIIDTHCLRVNGIIENVMQLSRRQAPDLQPTDLKRWLKSFVEHFHTNENAKVLIQLSERPLEANIDSHQLGRIVSNLVGNGLRHSLDYSGSEEVTVSLEWDEMRQQAHIDIIDKGPGIKAGEHNKIFEPFYTTHSEGSGLGLYIVKELCEANQISITIQESEPGLSCFRLRFPQTEAMAQ